MLKSSSPSRIRRRLLLVSVAALAGTPSVQAEDRFAAGVEHTIFCAHLFLTDMKRHAENCLPSRVPPDFFKWDNNSSPGDYVTPPPPPPVVAATPPVDCGPVDCGPTDCGPTDCGPADCGPAT